MIVLFQDTLLVHVISQTDFFGTAQKIGDLDGRIVELFLFAGAVYFMVCFGLSRVVRRLSRRVG